MRIETERKLFPWRTAAGKLFHTHLATETGVDK